jgi:hypothetical protein
MNVFQAGTFEVLLVNLASIFKDQTNTLLFTNGKLNKRVMNRSGFLLKSMFDFAKRLNTLQLTDDETALFSASVIVVTGMCITF